MPSNDKIFIDSIFELSPKVNYTDPIVRHDPVIGKQTVAKLNMTPDTEEKPFSSEDSTDIKSIEAIDIPVIMVNNTVLDYSNILSMTLNYDSFLPSLILIVNQPYKEISTSDSPGLNNIVTVIMTSRVDGAYKPISINFYIDNIKTYGDKLYYYCNYKLLELEQNKIEQITFNPAPDKGCDGEFCQLPANEHPTTYEFLHVIAERAGLGFAATDQTKEISDDKYRFITNQTYKDVIEQHTKFGGLDENSVFDVWIDLYRYIVLTNVSWVLSEEVFPEDVGMFIEHSSAIDDIANKDNQTDTMIRRFLTNFKEVSAGFNITIESYKWMTNNKSIRTNGLSNQFFIGSPLAYKDDNNGSVFQNDIEIEDDSKDGQEYRDDYDFQKISFLGFEMGNADLGYSPVLYQEQIRNNFFRKIRQKRLEVVLSNTNMALQRGTLIYLYIVEYNDTNKRRFLGEDLMKDPLVDSMVEQGVPLANPYLSGMWYIDGMEFRYDKYNAKIKQVLYLIKKGPYDNPNSLTDPDIDKN